MIEIYKEEWQRENKTITISRDFLEHILNCLANQKFISEAPPNGDAMAMEESEYKKVQREGQEAIDKAWKQGMFLLSLNYLKGEEYKNKLESFASFWNESIPEIIENRDKDIQEFKDDDNIAFKWQHLVDQEIRMWINLGCHSHSAIDVENEKYEVGQVDIEDFNCIVERRGFTPRMTLFLIKILKHVGIGNNLSK